MRNLETYISEEYIVEELSEMINEGFFDKLKQMLGISVDATKKAIKNLPTEIKKSYVAGQIAAAKAKDEEIKKEAAKAAAAAERGEKEYLAFYKEIAAKLANGKLEEMSDRLAKDPKNALYYMTMVKTLKELGKKHNDNEAVENAEKLQKAINDKYMNAEKDLEKLEQQVEQSKVVDKAESENEKGAENKEGEADPKEIKSDVNDTISDNKDILGPLAEEAGVDGQKLRDYVAAIIKKGLSDNVEITDDKSILGACIMTCGAIITGDNKRFEDVCSLIGIDSAEKLMEEINNQK